MKKNIYKKIALVLSTLAVSVIVAYAVLAWTEPAQNPPTGNIFAPINTSNTTQTKAGGLNISGNVGIGTTAPIKKLDVAGDINGQSGLCINNDCCSSWADCVAKGTTCKAIGVACAANTDCCSSLCTSGSCANPPSCKANGTTCTTSSNCCSSSCTDGVCTGGGSCKDSLAACTTNAECCTGVCFSGSCTFYYPCENVDLPSGSKKIFVTSAPYLGNQILNDAAANAVCNNLGSALSPTPNYKALVYLGGQLQTDVIHNVSYWNPQKSGTECKWEIIASGSGDFFSLNPDGINYITKPILCDEKGNCQANRRVWTNFKPNGSGGATQLWVGNGSGGVTSSNSGRRCPWCTWQLGQYCSISQFGPCLEQRTMPGPIRTDTFYWYGINSKSDIGWSFAGVYDPNSSLLASCTGIGAGVSGTNCMNNESAALYCVEQ